MNKNHGTVLITGASAGIGHELALEFGARAETLVLVARRLDRLEKLRAELLERKPGLKVVALPADLSDGHNIETMPGRVAEQAGPVDVLVNNAGVGEAALFDRSDWARTRQILRTNIFAVTQLSWAFVPGMVKRGRGGVLNIGSGAGLAVMPNAAAYVGSKHFVAGFSEALRADLAGTGVTVTQVCPGPVDSEFDQVAGSVGGMAGALPQFFRISAAQCAREALAGLVESTETRPNAYAFRTKPCGLAIRLSADKPNTEHPGQGIIIWLRSSDATHLYEELRRRGVLIVEQLRQGPFGMTFAFQDPDGYVLTVHDGG